MSDTTTLINLGNADYNEAMHGWRCSVLKLKGARVQALFANGAQIAKGDYETKNEFIRFKEGRAPSQPPAQLAVHIELKGALDRTKWLKILAIVLPFVGAIVGAVIKELGEIMRMPLPAHKFVVMKPTVKGEPSQAALTLRFNKNRVSGEAAADDKSWIYSGYLNTGFMVLADRSATDHGIGFGVHILESASGSPDEFIGYWRGNWCNDDVQPSKREIRQCPVVLVEGEMNGLAVQRAREKYRDFLNPGGCVVQPLSPDSKTLACPAKPGGPQASVR